MLTAVVPTEKPKQQSACIKLNIGCGPVHPAGWINVDGSNRAWLASRLPWLNSLLVTLRLLEPTEFGRQTFFANLTHRFPWEDNSADAVYMGEVLEHFTPEDGKKVVEECYRVLRPGGVLRIRVPDNARFWSNYVKEYNEAKQLPRQQWTQKHTRWVEMFFHDICVRPKPLRSMGHYHKWMYDDISLIQLLETIGFSEVDTMAFLDSRIPDVKDVEMRDDLIVEAVKPQHGRP